MGRNFTISLYNVSEFHHLIVQCVEYKPLRVADVAETITEPQQE